MVELPVVRFFFVKWRYEPGCTFCCLWLYGRQWGLYVALENNEGKTIDVTNSIVEFWTENWVRANDAFKKILQTDEDFKVFFGKIFMVWDGKHRLQAWLLIINRDHTYDPVWHYVVEKIILDIKGNIATMLAALYEVNW